MKELRVAGISTIGADNRFLGAVLILFLNERFAVEPVVPKDAHRRLLKGTNLDRFLSETCTRSVGADSTFRWASRGYQIPKSQARGLAPRAKISVGLRLEGTTESWVKNRRFDVELVAEPPEAPPRPKLAAEGPGPVTAHPPRPRPAPPRPGPGHPRRKAIAREV